MTTPGTDLPPRADVLVIGGGIVAVACAFELSRFGLDVVVVERRSRLGTLTTAASAGSFRAQWQDPTNIALMLEGISFFEQAGERLGLPGLDIGLCQHGYLFVTAEAGGPEAVRQRVEAQRSAGLREAEALDGGEARQHFPYLGPLVTAASFHPRDGWLDPLRLVNAYARASGATICLDTAVVGIERDRDGLSAVLTSRGRVATRAAVLATGPFAAEVAALAEIVLPLVNRWRQRIVLAPLPIVPEWAPMTIDADSGAHWRPEVGGALLAWADHDRDSLPSHEPWLDATFPARAVQAVARLTPFWREVVRTTPGGAPQLTAPIALHTAGQYTISPDHNPLLGPHPVLPGLHLACGLSGHGIMLAPATARIVAAGIAGQPVDNPFPADRFDREATLGQAERMGL